MYVHTQTYSTQCIEIWQAKNDDWTINNISNLMALGSTLLVHVFGLFKD